VAPLRGTAFMLDVVLLTQVTRDALIQVTRNGVKGLTGGGTVEQTVWLGVECRDPRLWPKQTSHTFMRFL